MPITIGKEGKQFNKKKKKNEGVCSAGLVRNNSFHTTCVTYNIFSDFSYTYAFIQLLQNAQVDTVETAEIAGFPQIFISFSNQTFYKPL